MKTQRVAICVLLIVCVLTMSLSVFAVDPTPEPTFPSAEDTWVNPEVLWNEAGNYMLWVLLDSWGIKISSGEVGVYTDAVRETLTELVLEYLDSLPSPMSIWYWISPWNWTSDFWGNFAFNSSMLEDVQDFANWLKEKFGIEDNSSVGINVQYGINQYTLYKLNQKYVCQVINPSNINPPNNWLASHYLMSYNTDTNIDTSDVYYFIQYNEKAGGSDKYNLVVISINSKADMLVNTHAYFENGQMVDSAYESDWVTLHGDSMSGNYYRTIITGMHESIRGNYLYWIPANAVIFNGTNADVYNFLQNAVITADGVSIVSGDIVLPSDNTDYQNGDSVIIIDGEPQYEQITFPDSIAVNNLPAIITQRKIPDIGNDSENPGFSVPWQAINGLIQYVAAPAGAIIAIVNEAPVEGVIMLYALIGGIIIFGMIRIMRDH